MADGARFLYVISHERSGTHFLINTIQLNSAVDLTYLSVGEWFGPYDRFSQQFQHLEERFASLNPNHCYILKSHCDRALFNAQYPRGKVVYIFRDYRDVLVSYYHFLRDAHLAWARQYNSSIPTVWFSTFSDFLRQPLPDFLRFNYSLDGQFYSPIERWLSHTIGWLNNRLKDIFIVTYNQLYCEAEETTRRLFAFLELPAKLTFTRPNFQNSYSVMPRKGIIGDWRNHFLPEDIMLLSPMVQPYLSLLDQFPWQVELEVI